MKQLYKFLEEMGGGSGPGLGAATPGNTTGMGNPQMPEGDTPGSEPLSKPKSEKEKIRKRKKKIKSEEE